MINVTEIAEKEMRKALSDKGDSPVVRVFIAGFG